MKFSPANPLIAGAALSALATGAFAAPVETCQSDICFSVAVPTSAASSNSGNLYFQIKAPATYSWIALGTGSRMANSNIFVMYQDGSGNVTISPRKATGHVMPTVDTSSNGAKLTLLAGSGVSGDTMTANVACANCQSWGSGTMSLASTSSSWIAAWKSGSSLASTSDSQQISRHDDHANFNIDLTQATVTSDTNPFVTTSGSGNSGSGSGSGTSGSGSSNSGSGGAVTVGGSSSRGISLVLVHGVLMTVVFAAMYPIGSALMPLIGSWVVHGAWQFLAFLGMWAGFAIGYMYARDNGYLFTNSHTTLGTVVVSLLGIQPALGYIHHRQYTKTQSRGIFSHAHIWYGRALMILGIVNGGLGLQLAGLPRTFTIAYSVVAGVMFIVYLAAAAFGTVKKSRAGPRPVRSKEQPSTHSTSSPY